MRNPALRNIASVQDQVGIHQLVGSRCSPNGPIGTVPWLERVLPVVMKLANAHPGRTVFTRFVPPLHPEDARGTWRRWRHTTGDQIDPRLIQMVPALPTPPPPAIVIDKACYAPFKAPVFLATLRRLKAGTLIITARRQKGPLRLVGLPAAVTV